MFDIQKASRSAVNECTHHGWYACLSHNGTVIAAFPKETHYRAFIESDAWFILYEQNKAWQNA